MRKSREVAYGIPNDFTHMRVIHMAPSEDSSLGGPYAPTAAGYWFSQPVFFKSHGDIICFAPAEGHCGQARPRKPPGYQTASAVSLLLNVVTMGCEMRVRSRNARGKLRCPAEYSPRHVGVESAPRHGRLDEQQGGNG